MRRCFFTAAILTAFLAASCPPSRAANTIDPNGLGATDVVTGILSPGGPDDATLTNPLTDPLNLEPNYLAVGVTQSGELRIDGGSDVSSNLGYIGYGPGSTGLVTVDGVGSTWIEPSVSGGLSVGYNGDGAIEITSGGEVGTYRATIGEAAGSTGAVTVDGNGSTLTIQDSYDSLAVGKGGDGSLAISGGAAVTNADASVGAGAGVTGEVTVQGVGSTWTNSGELSIASSGAGTVDVAGGGAVSSVGGVVAHYSGSTGTVTIDGAGSMWTSSDTVYVGLSGDGTLNVTDGGTVETSFAYLGDLSGSTGTATVDGISSRWTISGNLAVGEDGAGTLNLLNGGEVIASGSVETGDLGSILFNSGTLTTTTLRADAADLLGTGAIHTNGLVGDIGGVDLVFDETHGASDTVLVDDQPGQNLTVHLDLSGAKNAGQLSVGYRTAGSMRVADGVEVQTSGGCDIGYEAGSTGMVTIDGSGSSWTNSGSVYVGRSGAGTLNVAGGGVVESGYAYLGESLNSNGAATVDGSGSSWTSLVLTVGGNGDGMLAITDGGAVFVTRPASRYLSPIGHHSDSTGQVAVDGAGSTLSFNTSVEVGSAGQGTLTLTNGGLAKVAGTLTIDADLDGDSFVNMATGGMLALAGDADDSLFQFLELVEGTDAIRYWNDVSSDWADIAGAAYGNDYTLEYLASGDLSGYTLLTVGQAGLPGDYNDDGIVDAADYTVWRDNLGSNVTLPGDTTPGLVTSADYDVWRSNFGASSAALNAGRAAVPEPSALLLLGLGAMLFTLARRNCN